MLIILQVGMDKNIASLSVPLGQLKEEVLVSVCVRSQSGIGTQERLNENRHSQ